MLIRSLLTLLCVASLVTVRAEDLSQYNTAADLWSHINSLRQGPAEELKSDEDLVAFVRNLNAAAETYLKKYPNDPNRWEAKLVAAKTAAMLNEFGLPDYSLEKIMALAQEVASDQEAPAKLRGDAAVLVLTLAVQGDRATFEKAMAQFRKDFPGDPRADGLQLTYAQQLLSLGDVEASNKVLKELSANPDERIAEIAKGMLASNALLGKPVDLSFTAVDGRKVNVADMKGKVVLIDFWATWCGPCMMMLPEILSIYETYHDKGLEIVGISLDQNQSRLLSVVKAKGMTWPQYFDGKGWMNDIARRYGISTIPRMWLVDRNGNLVSNDVGADIEGAVKKLIESTPEKPKSKPKK